MNDLTVHSMANAAFSGVGDFARWALYCPATANKVEIIKMDNVFQSFSSTRLKQKDMLNTTSMSPTIQVRFHPNSTGKVL